jgi:hypothetical protein
MPKLLATPPILHHPHDATHCHAPKHTTLQQKHTYQTNSSQQSFFRNQPLSQLDAVAKDTLNVDRLPTLPIVHDLALHYDIYIFVISKNGNAPIFTNHAYLITDHNRANSDRIKAPELTDVLLATPVDPIDSYC